MPNSRCTMLCRIETQKTPSSMAVEAWPANFMPSYSVVSPGMNPATPTTRNTTAKIMAVSCAGFLVLTVFVMIFPSALGMTEYPGSGAQTVGSHPGMDELLGIYLRDQLALGIAWRELARRAARNNKGVPA